MNTLGEQRCIEDLVGLFLRVVQENRLSNVVSRLKNQEISMFRDISNEFFIEGYGTVLMRDKECVLHIQVEREEYPAILWSCNPGGFNEYELEELEWGNEFIDPNTEDDFPDVNTSTPFELWEYVREKVISSNSVLAPL